MLDIRPARHRAISPHTNGRRVSVDFTDDVVYKEKDVRLGAMGPRVATHEHVRARLVREYEDIERAIALLELKNRGARFVVEVPRISLD